MIVVVDYGVGNLHSVRRALERAGASVEVTSDPACVARAKALVLPGVGAFRDAMNVLERSRLAQAVKDAVTRGKPFLGICLGLQMLFSESEEFGGAKGLGLFPGKVVRFSQNLKVPHMGWNEVRFTRKSALTEGLAGSAYFYFVHSYYVVPEEKEWVGGVCDYGGEFCCMIEKDNVAAVQFHPEKSQAAGLRLLQNFVRRAKVSPSFVETASEE